MKNLLRKINAEAKEISLGGGKKASQPEKAPLP
jgi:hypothetical protein